jgi:hypothetical protein
MAITRPEQTAKTPDGGGFLTGLTVLTADRMDHVDLTDREAPTGQLVNLVNKLNSQHC